MKSVVLCHSLVFLTCFITVCRMNFVRTTINNNITQLQNEAVGNTSKRQTQVKDSSRDKQTKSTSEEFHRRDAKRQNDSKTW